jgi:lipoic acid synthetase
VITSVDRDDLRDGGAQHFVDCIRAVRTQSPRTTIEVLVPDFRGRLDVALGILNAAPPDVMNHNLESVPRLYAQVRPGSDYAHSLMLLKKFRALYPDVPTKSGLMLGLGETDEEILQVMRDLRAHDVQMLPGHTLGQYLQPSGGHLPVLRYAHPDVFARCSNARRKPWASRTPPAAADGAAARRRVPKPRPRRRSGRPAPACRRAPAARAARPAA